MTVAAKPPRLAVSPVLRSWSPSFWPGRPLNSLPALLFPLFPTGFVFPGLTYVPVVAHRFGFVVAFALALAAPAVPRGRAQPVEVGVSGDEVGCGHQAVLRMMGAPAGVGFPLLDGSLTAASCPQPWLISRG